MELVELLGLVAVAGDDERAGAADGRRRGLLQLGAEVGEAVERAQPEVEQRFLAELHLGDRREHARGVAPRAVLLGLEHERAQAALGGPPRDGEADDAPPTTATSCCSRLRDTAYHPPYAGITRIRFDGRRPGAALSARGGLP